MSAPRPGPSGHGAPWVPLRTAMRILHHSRCGAPGKTHGSSVQEGGLRGARVVYNFQIPFNMGLKGSASRTRVEGSGAPLGGQWRRRAGAGVERGVPGFEETAGATGFRAAPRRNQDALAYRWKRVRLHGALAQLARHATTRSLLVVGEGVSASRSGCGRGPAWECPALWFPVPGRPIPVTIHVLS